MLFGSAVILAGGKSERMGFDKQEIMGEGMCLTHRLIDQLGEIFSEIIVVTNRPDLYEGKDVILTKDEYVDIGPLAGIHAGLKSAKSSFVYFMACDMTCVPVSYVNFLKDTVYEELNITDGTTVIDFNPDGIFTEREGNWVETFNAFYSKSLIPKIEMAVSEGERSINRFLKGVNTIILDRGLVEREFGTELFDNINTPGDLESYKNRISGGEE